MRVINLYPNFATNKQYIMPTIFILLGFRFQFYSNEHSPIHIHVIKNGSRAKYTIMPVRLVENFGFKISELKMIESIIEENQEIIAEHWNKYFNN